MITFDTLLFGSYTYVYKSKNYDRNIYEATNEKHYLIVFSNDYDQFISDLKQFSLYDEFMQSN